MSDVNVSRRYRSKTRDEAARQTRRAVLAAAGELFIAQGYEATTVDQIAEHAGVSRPTVFAVGSKAQLLKLARDIAIAGDDELVAVADRPAFADIAAATTSDDVLRSYARVSAHIGRRFGALNEVLRERARDPELAELWQVSEDERLAGARMVIKAVRAKGPLKPGLTPERAAEVLWLLTDVSVQRRLVVERGWSVARFERWYADAMIDLLLP
ncbi:MAG: putative transcriptional regulator, TetR family [Pseudonocardiales bacterium]|nr:putative transcriptional regulator, TetR family [Pseudonocardiales bacterium]